MDITLIGKDIIYKSRLPEIIRGNYWIIGENGKKIINIESLNGKWIINSSNNVKVLDPKKTECCNIEQIKTMANLKENIIDTVILNEYSFVGVCLCNSSNDILILYVSPVYEKNFECLEMTTFKEIFIGKEFNNQIVYNSPLISENHAKIFYNNGRLVLENLDTSFGTFVNNHPVTDKLKLLFNGDIIFIMGLKIIIMGRKIYINNPFNSATYDKNYFSIDDSNKINELKWENFRDDSNDDDVKLYTDKDYFARAPRITNKIKREKIVIDKPPESQNKEGTPILLTLGSTLGMGLIMVISSLMTVDGLTSGTASISKIFLSSFTSIAMLICMVLFPFINSRYQKKKKKKNEKKRQKRYKEYIDSKIILIDNIMNEQKNILYENYISSEECAKIIIERSSRLWERKIEDEDFLAIRLGIGDIPLDIDIEYPKIEFSMEDDNLINILNTIVGKSKILEKVPITISLAKKNICGFIVNDEKIEEKFLQNILMQLIALHSYSDLKLVFLLKGDGNRKLEHLKDLPHIWDNEKRVRFWAEDYNEMKEISQYLEKIFESRITEKENVDYKSFDSYYLIITNDYKKIENLKIITNILNSKFNVGFGIFCITNNLVILPNNCQIFINLDGNNGTVFQNEITESTKKEFIFDASYTFFFEKIGKQLSDIPIKYSQQNSMSLPETYTFLEMYDVGKIESLNILERWRSNDSTVTLAAPIGIDASGMPITLDIHEKFHGPHGLIAGSTGSGKSEFIITYILSLAVNYHPNDVALILIDYKGGGLAGAFQKNEIKLPHLIGTITNIDTVGLQRSLVSIKSELKRRQMLFNEARNNVNEGTIDIYKYQKLYYQKVVTEPIPHLLIICDEFAELKQQQPDFMDELISVARIGRSLGVHLILATQKPAGIVNDQIRSNSKFAICLKVQDRADSMDVIKRPEACELKKAGQFYMQVGNNEYFTLGQSAWSGAPYIPSDVIKKPVDNSIKIISNTGLVIKETNNNKKTISNSKGEQLTNIVKYIYEISKEENIKIKPLWLENIPEKIYISDIKEKYNVVETVNVINPVVGEFDDPANQRQDVVRLDFSNYGNTIIFGNAESGKETLLGTAIYDIMISHTANEIQMYLLDFGSEFLKTFKDAPVVGDVAFVNDSEKILRLFEKLQKDIKNRTKILSEYGGSYKLYINEVGNIMPMILVILNNYEAFSENYSDDFDDLLLTLTREGTKCGIVFLFTTNQPTSIRYRLSSNFKQKIALQMNNEDDYFNIFEGVGKKRPLRVFGRGLIKMENIYEFQTAQVCEPEKWNLCIKNTIEKLRKNCKIFAENIPVLPDIVNIEDVEQELKGISKIPLGIIKESLNISTYNFSQNLINLISAKNIDIIAKFVFNIINELKKLKDVNVVLLDAEQILSSESNVNFEYKNFIIEMTNNLHKNKNIICIIIGINKFLNSVEDGEEGFAETLKFADGLKNYNFIIVDTYTKIKAREFNKWYKNYISGDRGIWIGNGISDQTIYRLNVSYRELVNNCENDFGYVINREKPTLVKLLGMKKKEEEYE